MEPIKIRLGEENHIYIEQDIKRSQLFAEQYEQLIRKMTEYIGRVEKETVSTEYSGRNDNNIFLINGERGAGKTSMLVSMHRHLQQEDNVFERKFLRLQVIDPSSFSDNANILQIIIAELFKTFKDATKDKTIGYEAKNEITKLFVQIKHALCVLESPTLASKMDDSDIESLADMSNAMQLEDLIELLVENMLGVTGKDMLFVCVDDLDLNTRHAYDMLEQIRKYLILPKIVILIAAKTKQLQDVVQQYNLCEYRQLIDKSILTNEDILEISNKYLLKLFPLEHRIDLNTVIEKFHQPIEVWDGDKNVASASNGDELIYKLIYQKTGLQYLLEKDGVNYIVPNNLRAYRFLVKMLCDMQDELKEENISAYQQYFLSEWVPEHLKSDERKDIYEILTDMDLKKINKKIVMSIDNKLLVADNHELIKVLVDISNVYTNVSLGDVMALIIWSKSINSSEQFARYIYAIKHAYTILLEKAYLDMQKEENIQKKINMYNNPEASEYMYDYQYLVGGALLNGYTWDYLLPLFNDTENRLHRTIAIHTNSIPNVPHLLKLLILVSNRSKMVNEGEAYRKQMPVYYTQPILRSTNDVIIDWFNILYTIPFCIEQISRFGGDDAKQHMMNILRKDGDSDEVIIRSFFEMCIHSVDFLERIYWHIRENRNYIRTGTAKLDIYKRLLKTIYEVEYEEYIFSEEKDRLGQLLFVVHTMIDEEAETITKLIEEIPQTPTKPIGYPELSTIRLCQTAEQLKGRMRYINTAKGYDPVWLDSQFDSLGITDEEVQNQDPRTIRNRLKRIKA